MGFTGSPADYHGTDAYEPGEVVVFEFPHEHREEIEELLAIYAHRQDEGSPDTYLWGTISPEAEHAGYTLSWITLSGDIPKDCAVGEYERIHFTARYARSGAIDLDGRLIPETIEIVDRGDEPSTGSTRDPET